MPTLIEEGMELHADALQGAGGLPFLYGRGRVKNKVFLVPASPRFADETTLGEAIIQVNSQDFLIPPADLVLGGTTVEPAEGDTLEALEADELTPTGELFEVAAGDSPAAWTWSNGFKTFYRIHSVRRRGATVAT